MSYKKRRKVNPIIVKSMEFLKIKDKKIMCKLLNISYPTLLNFYYDRNTSMKTKTKIKQGLLKLLKENNND